MNVSQALKQKNKLVIELKKQYQIAQKLIPKKKGMLDVIRCRQHWIKQLS
jgi:hypothetical protein